MSRPIQDQQQTADIFLAAAIEEPTPVLRRERNRMARVLKQPRVRNRYAARRFLAGIDRELAERAGRLSRGQRRRYRQWFREFVGTELAA